MRVILGVGLCSVLAFALILPAHANQAVDAGDSPIHGGGSAAGGAVAPGLTFQAVVPQNAQSSPFDSNILAETERAVSFASRFPSRQPPLPSPPIETRRSGSSRGPLASSGAPLDPVRVPVEQSPPTIAPRSDGVKAEDKPPETASSDVGSVDFSNPVQGSFAAGDVSTSASSGSSAPIGPTRRIAGAGSTGAQGGSADVHAAGGADDNQ